MAADAASVREDLAVSPDARRTEPVPAARWTQRVGWLIFIWLASVLALAMVAGAFRLLMAGVGLTR
jgi:hypothetical protein